MATTRITPLHIGKGRKVKTAIQQIIKYVENPEKTDNGRLICLRSTIGIACEFELKRLNECSEYNFYVSREHCICLKLTI